MSADTRPTLPTCSVEGCEREARSKSSGVCVTHYRRLARTGDAGDSTIRVYRVDRECSVEGCSRTGPIVLGMCRTHYYQRYNANREQKHMNMPVFKLKIDYPPMTGNKTYRRLRSGHVYMQPQAAKYKKETVNRVKECFGEWCAQINDSVDRWIGEETEFEVQMTVVPPDRRRRDIDNIIKIILDALEGGGVFKNDSHVGTLIVRRRPPEKPGSVYIEVSLNT